MQVRACVCHDGFNSSGVADLSDFLCYNNNQHYYDDGLSSSNITWRYIERYWYAYARLKYNIITKHHETRLAPVPVRPSGSDDARPARSIWRLPRFQPGRLLLLLLIYYTVVVSGVCDIVGISHSYGTYTWRIPYIYRYLLSSRRTGSKIISSGGGGRRRNIIWIS